MRPEWNAPSSLATPYELFRLGWDTVRIARYWSITEAEAEKRVTTVRSRRLGLPSPYEEAA